MAWYTDLFCRVSFRGKTYNDIQDVCDDLDNINEYMKVIEEEMCDMALITDPDKMFSMSIKHDSCDALDVLQTKFNQNMDLLEEYCDEIVKLELLKDNWKACHNQDGTAKQPPESFDWDDCYMDGDFIKTQKD